MPLKIQMELLADLKRFGLNPHDWTFRPANNAHYQIQHRQDPEFKFSGKIGRRRQKLEWQQLELQSL